MDNYFSYSNINWDKYIYLFDKYKYIQAIFIIPNNSCNQCLQISTINDKHFKNIYDVTFNKIFNLNKIGPFIVKKKYTKNFTDNIEESMISFYLDNMYFKWIGVTDESIDLYNDNSFKIFNELNLKNICYMIPYRNRKETIEITVSKIEDYIVCKNLNANVWIIEQKNNVNWNKGCTLNIGYKALEKYYDYFIINDADTFLKNDYNIILPKENEIIHIYGYKHCLGGIFILSKNTFKKLNGFSNNFFNWGREDRELIDRCESNKITINRKYLQFNTNDIEELKHTNSNNYWNYEPNTYEYDKAKILYYFNNITHFNSINDNSLSNLKIGSCNSNCKIILFVSLEENNNGHILINNYTNIIKLEMKKNNMIVLEINKIEHNIPFINSGKEIKIEIFKKSNKFFISFKFDLFYEFTFEINNYNQNKIEVSYYNIKKKFDIIYTPFNDKIILYNYHSIYYNPFVYYLNVCY